MAGKPFSFEHNLTHKHFPIFYALIFFQIGWREKANDLSRPWPQQWNVRRNRRSQKDTSPRQQQHLPPRQTHCQAGAEIIGHQCSHDVLGVARGLRGLMHQRRYNLYLNFARQRFQSTTNSGHHPDQGRAEPDDNCSLHQRRKGIN